MKEGVSTKEQQSNALKEAISQLLHDHPEFEEENTTGWDMMEALKDLWNVLNPIPASEAFKKLYDKIKGHPSVIGGGVKVQNGMEVIFIYVAEDGEPIWIPKVYHEYKVITEKTGRFYFL